MKAARIASLVIGCLLLIPGAAMLFGGAALGLGAAVGRDDGYFEFTLDRLQTPTAAIRSDDVEFFVDPGTPDWLIDMIDADVRIEATPVDAESALFVGIGSSAEVDAYLLGVRHDTVVDVNDHDSPQYRRFDGSRRLAPPVEQDFWVATPDRTAPTTVEWNVETGEWAAVLANADGSPGIAADVTVGLKSDAFVPIALTVLGLGVLFLAAGVVLVVAGTKRDRGEDDHPRSGTAPSAVAAAGDGAATREHPVAVNAVLDPGLSRWMWLVKWFLAIPHCIVLAFLWVAFAVVTVIAGVAILFTGRYPERLFEFNLGVLRWTWRVNYYASSGGLGTDRYPPFSLGREPDYPAVLDIAYPEQLSRGLVLVKWWLLAIPHYLIVALLVGGSVAWSDAGPNGWQFQSGGLLGLLMVITGAILLFTGRYPRPLFDLIVGFNRWIYRVIAYAALMTDRYPPFRLDQGGLEHGSPLAPPPTALGPAVSSPGPGQSASGADTA